MSVDTVDEARFGHARRSSGSAFLKILVVAVLIGGAAFALFYGLPNHWSLVLLGLFAAIGVGALIAGLFGLLRVSAGKTEEEIATALLRQENQGVAVADRSGDVRFANETYAALLPEGTVTLTPPILWSHDEEVRAALDGLRRSALDGRRASTEVRVEDGTTGWYLVSAQPLDLEGTRDVVWRVVDITEDRLAEEGLYQAAQEAVSYLDDVPVGFLAVRDDDVVEHLNATLAGFAGMDLAEFQRREMRLDRLFAETALTELANAQAEGRESIDTYMRTSGDDRPVTVLQRRGSGSHRRRLVAVVPRDNREFQETGITNGGAHKFDRFFDNAPFALAVVSKDGAIKRANPAFSQMFGSSVASAAKPLLQFVPDAVQSAVAGALKRLIDGSKSVDPIEFILPTDGDPNERYIRLSFTALAKAEPDEPRSILVHATEATEQKAIEAAYIQGQKMQAVGLLAGGLAHDFNNVLSAITMSADLLLETHGVGDPSHADIRNVKTSASKAAALVRQLLAFSRKQTLRPTVLNLADTLSDGRMLYQRLANPAQLNLELGSDLWPVKADLGQFEQVITNLVANARDAMPDGGTIVIGARNVAEAEAEGMSYRGFPAADYVMVEVVDTGIGMTPEVQSQVFDPFYTTKDVGKGTGLGMAMVYGIVKQSGGYIYLESEVGVGTRFRIMLPRYERSLDKDANDARTSAEGAEVARDLTGSGTVLVVEDDNAVRPGAVRALTSRGYTVHEAIDGEEALEILEELDGEVDIIVSDVVMPGMDGPTFLREMRAIYGDDIPFVFASGHAEDAFAKNLPEGSVFSFLPKPYTLSDLATKVKDVLAGRE